jgi:hypothetical protein
VLVSDRHWSDAPWSNRSGFMFLRLPSNCGGVRRVNRGRIHGSRRAVSHNF